MKELAKQLLLALLNTYKGIVFTDLFTSKESRKNKTKKATPKKCSKK